ncbi:MAG: nodulation protein NfeD [Chitinivibrionia bacterium]|nr:nodulation protein NfeD [Chitinivibrionia bacterium]
MNKRDSWDAVNIFLASALLLLIAAFHSAQNVSAHDANASPSAAASDSTPAPPADGAAAVFEGAIEGAIGPITAEYVLRLLAAAEKSHPICVLITMDTPGGLDLSMRSIIKGILASPVPVVLFIYPSGARAASAGALITLASHVAAMCPGTNIGAAHPVAIGEGDMDDEMAAKVTNDAAAYARSIAVQRNRDPDWVERIVRESISSTASEARDAGVVDFIANDVADLLDQMDGMRLSMNGTETVLRTANANITVMPPTFRERLLGKISEPNIAYLLMLLGMLGLFFELQNPGAIFPGVIGAISIITAFFSFQLLPVNISGIALIICAVIMFVLEIKITSGGLLTVGGIVSMIIGSIMFVDSPLPFMRVSLAVIIPSVVFTALFFMFAVALGLRAQRRKVSTGERGIIGESGTAKDDIDPEGSVFIHGEYWNAFSDSRIPAGAKVTAVEIHGMKLKVKPAEPKEVS